MITAIPFVPTPRLKFTEQFNQAQDDLQLRLLAQQREQQQRLQLKLEQYQEAQRREEQRVMIKELEENRQYMALDKQQVYWSYKYAYWAGSLVDKYI